MMFIGLILFVALLIPIIGIIIDSPIGRAMARRLEGPEAVPTDVQMLAKKVDLLEAEVDDLNRAVEQLKDENAFLQKLIGEPRAPRTLPPAAGS
jgi:hypothetical protein